MANSRSCHSAEHQMRSVADSLKPTGSRFDNEISYEINGCILTWIANDQGAEHRFDCSNIVEIIDGYYKAEFYLDTKRIFDAPSMIDSYDDNIQVELTGYIEQEATNSLSNRVDKNSNIRKIYTISSASTEADSLHETSNISRKDGAYWNHPYNSNKSQSQLLTSSLAKSANSNHAANKYAHLTTNTRQLTRADRIKDKSPTYPKKGMETRKQSSTTTTTTTFTLRSSRGNKTITASTNIYSRENTRAVAATHTRSFTAPKLEPAYPPPEAKKRKHNKSESSKKKSDIEVRRGERIRKVSIFQDCYIPAAKNEWISEVFIGAHRENF